MKKIGITIMGLLLVCVLFSLSLFPSVNADPAVMIQQYTLSPEILMPGDSAILTLTIKNAETTGTITTVESYTSEDTVESTTTVKTNGATIQNVRITPAYDGNKQIKATLNHPNIGFLSAGASFTLSFELIANENITEGLYFPKVNIDLEESIYEDVNYPIPVRVSNDSVDIIPTSVPSKISNGGATEVTVTVVNTRENAVNDVAITPKGTDVEFVPESYYIGSMDAKTSKDIIFSVKPSGTGALNISFNMSYKNGINLHTNTLVIPVTVIETLDVAPIITNFPISITKGGSSRISIEVYNAKTEGITGVLVTPICNTTVIPSQYFIGSMEPDDVFSASFNIYADTVDYGEQTIGFTVSYKQGNEYYETPIVSKSFSVVSGSGQSYQSSGSSTSSSGSNGMPQVPSLLTCLTPIIIIIVFIILFIFMYMRWKKRRKA
jgi:hypothetical protein